VVDGVSGMVKGNLQKKWGNATFAGIALCLMLAISAPALAQALPDPTRPPAGFVDPADAKASGLGVSAAPTDPASASAEPGMVLQSVLLPQKGKPVAVISGQYVPLGARINEWELKSVAEREVVLAQGASRRVLSLTPLVSKTMTKTVTAPTTTATNKKPVRAKKAKKSGTKESDLKR
jgi:MSHA biogenesis protein MshK